MDFMKVAAAAAAGVLLAIQFKHEKAEYGIYISVVLGIFIFAGIFGYLENMLELFRELEQELELEHSYVAILIKMLGITYVGGFVSAICKDAGYQSVALQIEIFSRIGIMVLCVPVMMTFLEVIRGFLG